MVNEALDLAARGLCVLPVSGKVPLTEHGAHSATMEATTIELWWDRYPRAGVAVSCGVGPLSPLVIDIDPRHDGHETMRELVDKHGPLPPGPRVLSGGGGYHVYLTSRPGASYPSELGPGVQIKKAGGYVVAPPSRHPDGGLYRWRRGQMPDRESGLSDAPQWMEITRPVQGSGIRASRRTDDSVARPAFNGSRNISAARLAGYLYAKHHTKPIVMDLVQCWAANCNPPLPAREAERVVESIWRYHRDRVEESGARNCKDPRWEEDFERWRFF